MPAYSKNKEGKDYTVAKCNHKDKGGRSKKTVKRDRLMAIKSTLYEQKVLDTKNKNTNLSV